ncbi:MAG: HAD-IIB family hydrolase [Candidatus Levybacteria bacterium]|nr:HAD-IIB family hydrolase [Candidatus Levybacteria bacterium]
MKLSKPKKKYKALILDVDGTLIPNEIDGIPSKGVTDAIRKITKRIHVGLATSRLYGLINHITDRLELSGPSITSAGARVIDISTKKILWEQCINQHAVIDVCRILEKYKLSVMVNDNGRDIGFSKKYIPKKPLTIFVISVSPKYIDYIVKEVSTISAISAHKVPSWKKGQITISITHKSATKQHALLELAKILKIETHEIIGVGDGHNDLPFLMACGLKIAMGNAVSELKAISHYVAPSVDNDGVADVINKFIL